MTLDYESDRLVSFCGAVILLIPSLLAVSCISKKVPEPAANKEEIEGKKKMKLMNRFLFYFYDKCVTILLEMFSSRRRHDDGLGADCGPGAAHRGAD